jgi:hypothetical protein
MGVLLVNIIVTFIVNFIITHPLLNLFVLPMFKNILQYFKERGSDAINTNYMDIVCKQKPYKYIVMT